jgi:hypothetical protein
VPNGMVNRLERSASGMGSRSLQAVVSLLVSSFRFRRVSKPSVPSIASQRPFQRARQRPE